jgi:hypothetical protein
MILSVAARTLTHLAKTDRPARVGVPGGRRQRRATVPAPSAHGLVRVKVYEPLPLYDSTRQ